MIDKIYLDKLDSAYMTILDMTKIDIKEKRREKARMGILKIFLLKNDTGDIIEYVEKSIDKNKKDFNFWKLIANNDE